MPIGIYKRTPENQRKRILSLKNPNVRRKMSEAQKGKKLSEETK